MGAELEPGFNDARDSTGVDLRSDDDSGPGSAEELPYLTRKSRLTLEQNARVMFGGMSCR
ncbi:hypothetical protein DPMN_164786 [Dreissena polymorpha]|uniref:Uncharacterized protein n=1 Tax=Dreissena polymorpha TaxID=45954 RepID=A0A9D4IWE5_DREPO|nr:hypothetical protein DPMN_164786 [Dreissena polymorpha]